MSGGGTYESTNCKTVIYHSLACHFLGRSHSANSAQEKSISVNEKWRCGAYHRLTLRRNELDARVIPRLITYVNNLVVRGRGHVARKRKLVSKAKQTHFLPLQSPKADELLFRFFTLIVRFMKLIELIIDFQRLDFLSASDQRTQKSRKRSYRFSGIAVTELERMRMENLSHFDWVMGSE